MTDLRYDIFIAHAGPDTETAEALYSLLQGQTHVFVDSKSLRPGDRWDVVLPEAQRNSRITVVLVSAATPKAFYQEEEIAAAIDLARRAEHRVVPVFLDSRPLHEDVPYGLRRLHAALIKDHSDLKPLAQQLVELVGGEEALRPPASDGNVLAAYRLGLVLRDGGNWDEAVEWLDRAASAGITAAATTLGIELRKRGQIDAAERWLREAAENEDAMASHTLGLLLEERGDIAEAIRWELQSATAGDPAAAATLGRMLREPHHDAGVDWLREAARSGDGWAIDELRRIGEA